MKLIQDGKVMAMDVGENIAWLGYSEMDQAGRILTGADPIADGNEMTPLRVFTKDNIDETGTPPTPDKGYGDAYVSGYGALWSGK
jgi:ribose transport system substrate-binding protein